MRKIILPVKTSVNQWACAHLLTKQQNLLKKMINGTLHLTALDLLKLPPKDITINVLIQLRLPVYTNKKNICVTD